MGRAVEAGRLSITYDPSFPPVEMAAWLRAHGADSCRHVGAGGIGAAVARGARFVTLDAVCADDLGAIAREILALPGRILWAGSSGLARALAAQLAGPGAAPWLPERGELLFCIGTDHRVTAEQERRLREERPGAAVLRVARGEPPVIARRPAALFISGGDTATLVCRGLAAEAIELRQEIAPGIPIGVLVGGRFPGLTVITKSGGFGAPDDLIHIADYFHA
jgi:uncharacterized protein YgbK (DUF1537 family)